MDKHVIPGVKVYMVGAADVPATVGAPLHLPPAVFLFRHSKPADHCHMSDKLVLPALPFPPSHTVHLPCSWMDMRPPKQRSLPCVPKASYRSAT
jgi:hypothetical protein